MSCASRGSALVGAVVFWLALVTPAAAQQPLADVLSFLLTNQAVPTGDFVKDAQSSAVTKAALTRLLLVELTTLPLNSSSAAFTYQPNAALGTIQQGSESFGPFFTERSLTAGRRRGSIGMTVQTVRYTHLDQLDLRDGSFLVAANQFRDEPQPFDVETLRLALGSTTVTFAGNLGVTDRLDIGVAVPVVRLTLEGSRVNTYRGARLLQATAFATTIGLADMAVRAKFRLTSPQSPTALAVIGELRLPTGRTEDLLGEGSASGGGLLTASWQVGRISLDLNGGASGSEVRKESRYGAAASFSPSPRLTLVGELAGRRIGNLGPLTPSRVTHPTIVGVDTLRLVVGPGSTSTAAIVAGAKWNVFGTWLLAGNVSIPATQRGLRSRFVTTVGLDYAFGG
ncbi:MAG: hypothetical protein ABI868_11280 [Acidobacteriota bacterium]